MANTGASTNDPRPTHDFEYKKELAYQLVKRFGLTAARQTCIENKWDEVLKAVETVRTH